MRPAPTVQHAVSARRRFADVTDPTYLRAAAEVLDSLLQDIDRLDASSDNGAVRALTVQWRGWARSRHRTLGDTAGSRQPVLLDPAALPERIGATGEATIPVITAGRVHTAGLCSAITHLSRRRATRAHVHHVTDVIVVVLRGEATTVWWDQHGRDHTVAQPPGSHLLIPAGTPHAHLALTDPVDALELRGGSDLLADIDLLPAFDAHIASHLTPSPST